MPILLGNYANGDFTRQQLTGFENIVFSACNDPRQLPPGATETQEAEFYHRMNSVGVPRFLALARDAGVSRKRRSEEHTSELQSLRHLVCRLLLEKKKNK